MAESYNRDRVLQFHPVVFVLLVLSLGLPGCAGNKAARELAVMGSQQTATTQVQFRSAAKAEEALLKQLTVVERSDLAQKAIDSGSYLVPVALKSDLLAKIDKKKSDNYKTLSTIANSQRESIAKTLAIYKEGSSTKVTTAKTPVGDAELKRLASIKKEGFDELSKEEEITAMVEQYGTFAKEVKEEMDKLKEAATEDAVKE